MNFQSLLLGSTAALIALSGARAADAVLVAEPESVEYVRVCDAYGKGFFYIPGSETCLKIGGHVRYQAKVGDDAGSGEDLKTYKQFSRATLRFDARSDTELGTLRSFIEATVQYDDDSKAKLPHAYIELGGFRIGTTDDLFGSWTGSAADVISDDVINYQSGKSNQVSYTFTGENGFSALIGLEQGEGEYTGVGLYAHQQSVEDKNAKKAKYAIDDYVPHVVAGAKYVQEWGSLSVVAGYDSKAEEFAVKARLNVKLTDGVSAFVMAAYQSDGDVHYERVNGKGSSVRKVNYFGQWYGDYAVWGGLSAKISSQATLNGQVAYEADGTVAGAANVKYELVSGFVITPEVNYTAFGGGREAVKNTSDAFGGIIRFQRNF